MAPGLITHWKNIKKPASYSSARYVAEAAGVKESAAKKQLEKSILFQAHRDLRTRFNRRSNMATYRNQTWEMDLGDMGGRIPPELSGQAIVQGKRRQLIMLVVVDIFTREIYAEAMKNKTGAEVVKALEKIFQTAGGTPLSIVCDSGLEFKNKQVAELAKRKGIAIRFAKNVLKARQCERAVRSLKRTIMGSLQTESWPSNVTWKEMPELASRSLRLRYNRMISATPAQVGKDPKLQNKLRKRELQRASFVAPAKYWSDENKLREGKRIGKFTVGDVVLPAIPKRRRLHHFDKEYQMQYDLIPAKIVEVFHERRPFLYVLKSLKTKRRFPRLFYATEMKKVTFPFDAEKIKDVRVKEGKAEYKLDDGSWHPLA